MGGGEEKREEEKMHMIEAQVRKPPTPTRATDVLIVEKTEWNKEERKKREKAPTQLPWWR